MNEDNLPKVVRLSTATYFNRSFLIEVEKEIQQKALKVRFGLETFTKAETLAYLVMENNGFFQVADEPATPN